MMFIAVVLLYAPFLGCNAQNGAKFKLHIREGHARFSQEISAEMYKNHVYYHTPAHNTIKETKKMQDFNKGLQLFCVIVKQECYLTHLNTTIYPHAGKTMESIARLWNNGTDGISDNEATIFTQNWLKSTEITSTTFLSQEMREFYETFNFPLYHLKKLPDDVVPLEVDTALPLTKRQFLPDDKKCANGVRATQKYGYTPTDGCDWLVFCDLNHHITQSDQYHQHSIASLDPNCDRRHIVDKLFFSCLCCPGAHRLSDCLQCDRV